MTLARTGLGAAAAFLLAASPAAAQRTTYRLPAGAVLYTKAPVAMEPDSRSVRPGERRTLRKGDALFRARLRAPSDARLRTARTLTLNGAPYTVDSRTIFERYVAFTGEEGAAVFCSAPASPASSFAADIVSNRYGRLCLVDSEADGEFEAAFLDGSFLNGRVPDTARTLLALEPLAYESVAPKRRAMEGELALVFDGFPATRDRFRVRLRYTGPASTYYLAKYLVDAGEGYVGYGSNTEFFVSYAPAGETRLDLMGVRIQLFGVDRKQAQLDLRIDSAGPARLFAVFDDSGAFPAFREYGRTGG